MKGKSTIWIFLLVIVIALAGCAKSQESSQNDSSQAQEKQGETVTSDYEINVGYYNCDHMVAGPVGEAAGIYKAHNLNVKLTGNGKVPQVMAAGQMDAGEWPEATRWGSPW